MLQATKIRTSRELYLYCIDVEYRTMLLPRFDYKFSMDRRKEAVQATIEEFVKSTISSKSDKRNVYSDSYSSYCGEQDAPSPTLLKKILMGYPIWNLYILDFIFRMMWRHQVVYVLVHGGLLVEK